MGQRVNIQYSVDLGDLDAEVNRLFDNAVKQLTTLAPPSFGYVSMDLSGIERIDELRQKLAKIDIALGDVQNIVEGYVHYKTEPQQKVEPEVTNDSEELEMEQLEDRIAKFKELLDAQSNQESEEANE